METRNQVAVVPGDDAAPEAVGATLRVLRALELPVHWLVLPSGEELGDGPRREAEDRIREAVDSTDTALFGATGGKTGGIAYLRWGKGTYANVRPVRWRPGAPSPLRDPSGIDYVIVRENLEDLYTGLEGELGALRDSGLPLQGYASLVGGTEGVETSADGRYAVKLTTRENVEKVARFACELALERGRQGKVTCAAKWNVLPRTDGLFAATVADVVGEYPDLTFERYLADDFARRLVVEPQAFDVVVLPNLYGDLLSDEGAATVGGLGVCPSGCYGDDYAYFEPVHGSAPDIAGRGVIDPIATMLSAAMLLVHLGYRDAAERLEGAVDGTIAAGDRLTPDLGGTGTTESLTEAVLSRL